EPRGAVLFVAYLPRDSSRMVSRRAQRKEEGVSGLGRGQLDRYASQELDRGNEQKVLTAMTNPQARCVENLAETRNGVPRLLCFPYAGGSAQLFRPWQRHLSMASLSLVHLPGRAARLGEPPFKQCKSLVNVLADAIIPQLPPAFAFFGHSMGALISFE